MILHSIILKAAAPCNLNCTYCYEYNRGDESWRDKPKHISGETARQVGSRIHEYCAHQEISEFSVNLHGGEPLLLGAEGLREVFSVLKEATPSIRLKLGVQTNATLITEKILDVFEEFKVAVGVSIDGNRQHNRWRVGHVGGTAHDKIVEGLERLRQRKRLFAGLQAVVDLDNEPAEVLNALAAYEPPSIDLLPPFGNFDNPPCTSPTRFSFGEWMTAAFRFWIDSKELQQIRIRYLEDAMVAVLSGESRSDWFGIRPPGYIVVATDGAIEGLDTLKVAGDFGRTTDLNVWTNCLREVIGHEVMTMRNRGVAGLCAQCRACPIVNWCGGGYLPTRFSKDNGFDNPSYFCEDLKHLFSEIGSWIVQSEGVSPAMAEPVRDRLAALASETVGIGSD